MLSNTQSLFNLFIALITLQQATSALALPTRGSYGQLARRANAAKRAAGSTSATQTARARLARAQNAIKRASAEKEAASSLASPVNSEEDSKHFATPSAHVIQVNPKLQLKQSEVSKAKLSAARNGTTFVETEVASSTTTEEEEESKAAAIGGGYSMFAANNGVAPSSSADVDAAQATPSSSSWVSATNVTLPSGLSKRELVANQAQAAPPSIMTPKAQLLKKRVVPHPGEPSATIKINVIGGDILQNFTIIETSSKATKTSSSIKTAATGINVNIVHNGTGSAVPEDEDATLLTFTFTLPITAISIGNETVTLKPAGNDSYIPYVNGKEVDTEENSGNHNKATCTIPVDDDVLVAVARGQTFYAVCVSSDAVAKKIKVKVDVSEASSSSSTSSKDKRQMIAHFESPSKASTEQKTKRQMVAFFQSPALASSEEEATESSTTREASIFSVEDSEDVQYTREYMMSDLWEDCIVGVDEGCLEVPEA